MKKHELKTGRADILVTPRSRVPGVEKLGTNEYRIRVRAAPEKGKANREALAALAEYLEVPASRLRIMRGHASRRKVVEILPG